MPQKAMTTCCMVWVLLGVFLFFFLSFNINYSGIFFNIFLEYFSCKQDETCCGFPSKVMLTHLPWLRLYSRPLNPKIQ